MSAIENIKKLVDYANQTFQDQIEEEFLKHLKEFRNDPDAKNAADVMWLFMAVLQKYKMFLENKDNFKHIEERFKQLAERLETTGGLINPEKGDSTTGQETSSNEPDFMIVHKNYKIDIFTTENGSLGLTVERCAYSDPIECEDNKKIDIFVDPALNVTTV